MEEERITTLHPQGKKGVNISKRKYDAARDAIIESFRVGGDMTFTRLAEDVRQRIGHRLPGLHKLVRRGQSSWTWRPWAYSKGSLEQNRNRLDL